MSPHILSIVLAIIACAAAKPSGFVPALGPGIVTAHSYATVNHGIVGLVPPLAAPAPRFYPAYVPTYSTGYYPFYRYGYTYPWGAYGPTVVRYPATTYW